MRDRIKLESTLVRQAITEATKGANDGESDEHLAHEVIEEDNGDLTKLKHFFNTVQKVYILNNVKGIDHAEKEAFMSNYI